MALDFWVKDEKGGVLAHAAVNYGLHTALVLHLGLYPMLRRASTYYGSEGNMSYTPTEASRLRAELDAVERDVRQTPQAFASSLLHSYKQLQEIYKAGLRGSFLPSRG
jgi:hypothetical protein